MSEVKIKIIEVKEIVTKDGRKFNAYKTVAKNGKKMDVRFTQDCNIKPVEPCFIYCDENECNVDTSRQYPALWVKNVLRTEPFLKKSNVLDYISTDDEELPFN